MPELWTPTDLIAAGSEPAVTDEAHVVGERVANYVFLRGRPLQESPSTVVVTGGITFTEVGATPAASGEFRVHYGLEVLEFHADDDGEAIQVDYKNRGSILRAYMVEDIHARLEGEVALASAATVEIPLVADGHRQYYIALGHAANFTLEATVPAGITFDLLIAPNNTGQGGPFTPTFAAADFAFVAAPTIDTTADTFSILGFLTRSNKAHFLGIQGPFAV